MSSNLWITNWNWRERKQSWSNMRCYPRICLEGPKYTTNNLKQPICGPSTLNTFVDARNLQEGTPKGLRTPCHVTQWQCWVGTCSKAWIFIYFIIVLFALSPSPTLSVFIPVSSLSHLICFFIPYFLGSFLTTHYVLHTLHGTGWTRTVNFTGHCSKLLWTLLEYNTGISLERLSKTSRKKSCSVTCSTSVLSKEKLHSYM